MSISIKNEGLICAILLALTFNHSAQANDNSAANVSTPHQFENLLNQVGSINKEADPKACVGAMVQAPADSSADGDGNGGSSGGGNAHTYRRNGPACFLGKDRVIKTCIVRDSQFDASEEEAAVALKTAFSKWKSYVEKNGLQNKPGLEPFATQIEIQSKCDGTEDLRVFLGVTNNPEVNQARSLYNEPWGLEKCTHSKNDPSWGKSILWIAPPHSIDKANPDWKAKNRLLGIMLRDVGRIFGNGVVPGTIMREDLAEMLKVRQDGLTDDALAQIDHGRALFDLEKAKHFVSTADSYKKQRITPAFTKLMGRKPQGTIKQEVVLAQAKNGRTSAGTLTVSDDLGIKKSFQIRLNKTLMCSRIGEGIFERNEGSKGAAVSTDSTACVDAGVLIDSKGKKYPISFVSNSTTFQYQMLFTDESEQTKQDILVE
jgi:hypothetical protein